MTFEKEAGMNPDINVGPIRIAVKPAQITKHWPSIFRAAVVRMLAILVLLMPVYGYADLYSWVDDKGIKHFANTPPADNLGKATKSGEYVPEEKEDTFPEAEDSDHAQKADKAHRAGKKRNRTGSGPKVNIKFKYYEFLSVNTNDVRDEMTKKTPIRWNGKKYRGLTNYRIKYNFYTGHIDKTWYIDRVFTTVDVTFTMPRWTDYRKANKDQQQKWDEYYNALMDHENGHKDIAVAAARKIENELLKLAHFLDEDQLKKTAHLRARMILRGYNARQKKFDLMTEHGKKTGVVLR
ncbi:MAG: DUF922 domain-containing protein [Desulfosarcinaceae bacterium]